MSQHQAGCSRGQGRQCQSGDVQVLPLVCLQDLLSFCGNWSFMYLVNICYTSLSLQGLPRWSYNQFDGVDHLIGNGINQLSITIWRCSCIELSPVLLEKGVAMITAFSRQNSVSLCLASFCTTRPNLPVTPGISWLPTIAFQSPMMKRTSFLVLTLEGLVGLHRTI